MMIFIIEGWFEKFLESPLTVSASTMRFPRKFKFGRESLDDDPFSRRQKSATTPVHKMVMEDLRLKARKIAEAVEISSEWVYHILTE